MDSRAIFADARAALELVTRATVGLLRSLPGTDVPIPGSAWTVREAAVHLASRGSLRAEIARGLPSPVRSMARPDLAVDNAERIADIPESDPGKLASLVANATDEFLEVTAGRSGAEPIVFHQGIHMDLTAVACVALGEAVLHGFDMASAVRRPWAIDPEHARLIVYGYRFLLPAIVNPQTASELTAAIAVELTGGPRLAVRFTDGHCAIEAVDPGPPDVSGDPGPLDVTISADPVAFLLFASGRISQWAAMALDLYRIGESRSELGLRFMDLFSYP